MAHTGIPLPVEELHFASGNSPGDLFDEVGHFAKVFEPIVAPAGSLSHAVMHHNGQLQSVQLLQVMLDWIADMDPFIICHPQYSSE